MGKLDTILRSYKNIIKVHGTTKVFGIGNNKTGTTSLKRAMIDLGFIVGNQRVGEKLMKDWSNRKYDNIIKSCRKANFFQDLPFSQPYTFIALDQAFPGSKFILSVRNSPEEWYNSLVEFHAKAWGLNGRTPTKEDLQNAEYVYKGWAWDVNRWLFSTPIDDPYEKKELVHRYLVHNQNVIDYFRHRPKDLLVLNVAEKGAYKKLCNFLEIKSEEKDFPWENKTEEFKNNDD